MTLRIVGDRSESGDVIALHGRLSRDEVEDLERVVADRGRPLNLDLAQLTGVDAEGLRVLRKLQRSGAHLTGVTPYIELPLERTAGDSGRLGEKRR